MTMFVNTPFEPPTTFAQAAAPLHRADRGLASAQNSATAIPVSCTGSYHAARLSALKAQIASGEFETPERIRGTVDRLLDVLF